VNGILKAGLVLLIAIAVIGGALLFGSSRNELPSIFKSTAPSATPVAEKATSWPAVAEGEEIRIALVIQQEDYSGNMSRLPGTKQEADLIASALDHLGFEVKRVRKPKKARVEFRNQGLPKEVGCRRRKRRRVYVLYRARSAESGK
jgi:hypothetical protein